MFCVILVILMMMRIVCVLFFVSVWLSPSCVSAQVKAVKTWVARKAEERKPLNKFAFYEKALNKEEAREIATLLFDAERGEEEKRANVGREMF